MLAIRKINHFSSNTNLKNFTFKHYPQMLYTTQTQTSEQRQTQQPKKFADPSIPGPKPLPILGNVHRLFLSRKPIAKRVLEIRLQDIKRYGVISKDALPGRTFLKISEPSDVSKILRSEAKYPSRTGFPLINTVWKCEGKSLDCFFLAVLNGTSTEA